MADYVAAATVADGAMRVALRNREAELIADLAKVGAAVDEVEHNAHAVLRCDPPCPSEDVLPAVIDALLCDRATRRAEEWGVWRVTLSQAAVLQAGDLSCTCRRQAWIVQGYTSSRRLQVIAVRLSALPPDGRACQLLDISWLDRKSVV